METPTLMNQLSSATSDAPTPRPAVDTDALQRLGDDLRRAIDALGDGGTDGPDAGEAVPGYEPPAAEAPPSFEDQIQDLKDEFERTQSRPPETTWMVNDNGGFSGLRY